MESDITIIQRSLGPMVEGLFNSLPNILIAIATFTVGWIVASVISKMVLKLGNKLGLDNLDDKLREIDIFKNVNIDLSKVLSKVVYFILMLFVVIVTASILGLEEVSNLVTTIFEFIPKVVVALVVLIFGTLLADGLKSIIYTTLKSLGIPSANLIATAAFYFLFINIVISALAQAEVNTAFLAQNLSIVIAGVVLAFAIAYGLASKDIMANLLSSYYSKNLFTVGDHVSIGDITGTVIEVNKATVKLRDKSDTIIVIPINKATSSIVRYHSK